MRIVAPLIALVLTTAAAPPQTDSEARSENEEQNEARVVEIDPATGKAICRDRIQQVRVERGLPSDVRPLPEPRKHRLMPAR